MFNIKKVKQIKDIIFNKKDKYIILNIPNTLLNNLNDDEQINNNKFKPNNNNQSNKPAKLVYTPQKGVINFNLSFLEEDKEGYKLIEEYTPTSPNNIIILKFVIPQKSLRQSGKTKI